MHEIRLNFVFRPLNELYLYYTNDVNTAPTLITSSPSLQVDLYADYIFLDNNERRRFAHIATEYLIEQVQALESPVIIPSLTTNKLIPIKFYHPIKEIIWYHGTSLHNTQSIYVDTSGGVPAPTQITTPNSWLNYGFYTYYTTADNIYDTFADATLEFNGNPRFERRNASYFRLFQNYQRHTNIPRVFMPSAFDGNIYAYSCKYIYTYSFALSPEEYQPSGTCNFSRIGSANMRMTYDWSALNNTNVTTDLIFNMYAVNYNILRIMNGQAGLAYLN